MRSFSNLLLVVPFAMVRAQVSFEPHKHQKPHLRGIEGLNDLWGSLHQNGFCIQQIENTEDNTSELVKFVSCDEWEPAQMWKFDDTGLLSNMHGGCLSVREAVDGNNLIIADCDFSDSKQHWWSDGDSLTPLYNPDYLCVSSTSGQEPIESKDAVILKDCEDAGALDY